MPDGTPVRPGQDRRSPEAEQALSEDIIQQVTDKVYDMLMHDLIIDRERQRPPSQMMGGFGSYRDGGGW